jgi:hypothetical protein
MEFNRTFSILYHNIPPIVEPSQTTTMVMYASSSESNFSLHLRKRKFAYLDSMFIDAEDIERNMRGSCLLPRIREDF